MKNALIHALALVLAALIWIPCLAGLHAPPDEELNAPTTNISEHTSELVTHQMRLWKEPNLRAKELGRMRASNAEWDFMGRSFLVWSLAELSLRDHSLTNDFLPVIDDIIDETLALESEKGFRHFLLPYASFRPYEVQPARSHFVDGEIALMLASRRMIQDTEKFRTLFRKRAHQLEERIGNSTLLCPESYPDECWMFDQSIGLAALAMGDHLDGTDHQSLFRSWLAVAKEKLTDRTTGLLISRFHLNGEAMDGPEGSSIWMIAHCLRLIDESFARDQYERARRELGHNWLGFGFAREWPDSWRSQADIDSGAVVPLLDASPASSGLALVGSSSFGDTRFFRALRASLALGGIPVKDGGELSYAASNQVGDAVILYAGTLGPMWNQILQSPRSP